MRSWQVSWWLYVHAFSFDINSDRFVVVCVLQKSSLIQSRLGGINQCTFTGTRSLSTNKPPKGKAPPNPIVTWHVYRTTNILTAICVMSLICIDFYVLSFFGVLRFWEVFPKDWREHWCQQISSKWRRYEASFRVFNPFPVTCLCLFQCFSSYNLDVNTKEQESFVREGQDGNGRNGDGGQEGEKKEEWQWWTRLQVWLSFFLYGLKLIIIVYLRLYIMLYTAN